MAAIRTTTVPPFRRGGTIHVIATSLAGTRAALDAATALARGHDGSRVVLFLRRHLTDALPGDEQTNEREQTLRQLADCYFPPPSVLSCASERAIDIVQLFQSPGVVVVGGTAHLYWWPTPEQRLARALTQLGCHVTFVHVPPHAFVPPLIAA
jgi:hypothetical protein